ncbi:hypothetical protein D1872_229830 [compost metagenome]
MLKSVRFCQKLSSRVISIGCLKAFAVRLRDQPSGQIINIDFTVTAIIRASRLIASGIYILDLVSCSVVDIMCRYRFVCIRYRDQTIKLVIGKRSPVAQGICLRQLIACRIIFVSQLLTLGIRNRRHPVHRIISVTLGEAQFIRLRQTVSGRIVIILDCGIRSTPFLYPRRQPVQSIIRIRNFAASRIGLLHQIAEKIVLIIRNKLYHFSIFSILVVSRGDDRIQSLLFHKPDSLNHSI